MRGSQGKEVNALNECPPPIDWLDFVEGRTNAGAANHLLTCFSCERVLERLKSPEGNRQQATSGAGRTSNDAWPRLEESHRDAAGFGEIWFTASTFQSPSVNYENLDRLPVVVLDSSFDTSGRAWYDVAPMWTDFENASESDLILESSDTTTGVPWRVLFSAQTVIERNQLDSYVGALVTSTGELVRALISGSIELGRFGAPLEGAYDSRSRSDEWVRRLVETIGMYRASMDDEEEPSNDPVASNKWSTVEYGPGRSKDTSFALAAAPAALPQVVRFARFQASSRQLEGSLSLDFESDRLVFEVTLATGRAGKVRLVATATPIEQRIQSTAFSPSAGMVVLVSQGLGISPLDVSTLEVEDAR